MSIIGYSSNENQLDLVCELVSRLKPEIYLELGIKEARTILEEIKKEKPKKVLLHLPDGLKPRAKEIQDKLKEKVEDSIKFATMYADAAPGFEKEAFQIALQHYFEMEQYGGGKDISKPRKNS